MGNSNATGRKDDPVPPHLWHTVMDSAGHRGGPGKAGVKDSSLAPGPTPDDGGLARLHRWVDDRLFERRRRDRIEAEARAREGGQSPTSGATSAAWERCFEVQATHDESRMGLYCRAEQLKPGDAYLRLPHELVMDVEKALRSPLIGASLRTLEAEFGFRDEPTELVLFLLSERSLGSASFFDPYIATLPSDEDFYHMPFYWSDEDLSELRGHAIFADVLDQRQTVADGWRRVEETTLRRFGHAYARGISGGGSSWGSMWRNNGWEAASSAEDPFPPNVFHPVAFRWAFHIWQSRCIRIHVGDEVANSAEEPGRNTPLSPHAPKYEVVPGSGVEEEEEKEEEEEEETMSHHTKDEPVDKGMDCVTSADGSTAVYTAGDVYKAMHVLPSECAANLSPPTPLGAPVPSQSHWAFIPFIDMTNCRFMKSQKASHTGYDRTQHTVVMRATEVYARNDQLYENCTYVGWFPALSFSMGI